MTNLIILLIVAIITYLCSDTFIRYIVNSNMRELERFVDDAEIEDKEGFFNHLPKLSSFVSILVTIPVVGVIGIVLAILS